MKTSLHLVAIKTKHPYVVLGKVNYPRLTFGFYKPANYNKTLDRFRHLLTLTFASFVLQRAMPK